MPRLLRLGIAAAEFMNFRRNQPCFCGSGKRYKNCHGALGEGYIPHDAAVADPPASAGTFPIRGAGSAEKFVRASQLHEEGQLERARELYEAVLSDVPDHFDALSALGKRVIVMLPFARGRLWYWHEGRDDSPWYPSVRLSGSLRSAIGRA